MIRFFDIIFSILGLLLLLPLFAIIAIFIKIESKGSAFYKQDRVGKKDKSFKLYKFRSMYTGSDNKGLITIGNNDSRITKVGFFIRRYKLDELPQLINVIKGEMSIVGPRPEVRKYVKLYSDEQRIVLSVKPGITDFASIYFRNENCLLSNETDPEKFYINNVISKKIELNLIFIRNRNILQYFKIILLTFLNLFK